MVAAGSHVRRRKADGPEQKGRSDRDATSDPKSGVKASNQEPPSLERLLLRVFFALLSVACFAYVLLPYVKDGRGPITWLQRVSPVRQESAAAHTARESTGSSSQAAEASPKQPTPEELALFQTRHLRPSLPFSIPQRAVPSQPVRTADVEKRNAVHQAFRDSWDSYVADAFGDDEYHPISHHGSNFSTDGGVGYFVVDTLDVLLLMGEKEEYNRARDWVRGLEWADKDGKFSVFETIIRTLGGLLSAHALCAPSQDNALSRKTSQLCDPGDDELFLSKAVTLAEHLRPAFTENKFGLPVRDINFMTGEGFADNDNRGMVSLAEVTTIQLEFKYLAHLTGDAAWWELAERPMQVARTASISAQSDGLLPIFLDPRTGHAMMSEIRLGSRGDSYYEYLIKQFAQTNSSELVYLDMYQRAATGIKRNLMKQSPKQQLLFTAEISPRRRPGSERPVFMLTPKQDHLVCFLGGSYMLGALHSQEEEPQSSVAPASYPPAHLSNLSLEDWTVGHELIRTCVETYSGTKTGLAAEITMFRIEGDSYPGSEEDWFIKKPKEGQQATPLIDARNILRPETVESLFIAFHLSGDEIYREWGWQIFEAFLRACRVPDSRAFASILDVDVPPKDVQREDRMETFWLAETLKYLYLLFDNQDALRLDQWVFNTEAHPLPVFSPQFPTSVS